MSFGRAILTIFLHSLMSKFAMAASNLTTDQAALLQLKAHISLDPNNFFANNWNLSATNTSNSVCNWVGVSCEGSHGRVTGLSIPNLGLGGTIPPHVGNLSFLDSLNISDNSFHGTLPNELWHLPRLRIIDLSSNSISGGLSDETCSSLTELETFDVSSNEITGQLPSSLGDCSKLRRLSVSSNEITGRIPRNIGNLTALMEVYLGGNNLQGEIPPTIFNISSLKVIVLGNNSLSGSLPVDLCRRLPSIEELNLRDCMIRGRIPKDIGNCTLLNYINLRENQLTGKIPDEIGNLHNLKLLDFGANNLTGLIPSTIFNNSNTEVIQLYGNHLFGNLPSNAGLNLPNLLRLYLWGNNLSGVIPGSICNASNFTVLDLSHNLFSGLVPTAFGNCRQLQILNLPYNHLTPGSFSQGRSFFSSLTNCRYLRYLGIQTNPWKGVLPNSIGNLSTSLEYFYAGSCELGGGIPAEFGNLSNIILLSLFDNQLASGIPTTVGKLQKLQGLDFSYNNLKGSIPYDLCQLERLNTLLLQGNALHDQIPFCLDNLTSLRELNLSSNRLNSTIPSTFWSLTYILRVDFSLNLLSGSLPLEIGNLDVLTGFSLSRNQISGYIPSSIGSLKDLTYLALARNAFQGPIPESIGSLIGLESLDLSGNMLSGEIPKSLESLSYLIYFNVSYNRLEGEIPSGGPFVNFSAESFTHNHALCGSRRLQVSACKTSSTQQSKSAQLVLRYVLPAIATTVVVLALIIIFIRCRMGNKNLPVENDLLNLPMENELLNLATWRRISYQELQKATEGFSESYLIGAGSFGSVYKATLAEGMDVAVKVFNLQEDGAHKSFDAECEVMSKIRHRNLVKVISSCSNHGFKALILQYMPHGSLEKWLYSHKCLLDIQQRLDIIIDVGHALEYLHLGHPKPVIHCDLKPSNVLLDDDMVAHLCDFGIAKLLDAEDYVTQTMTLATIGYMAPEYGSEGIVSTSGDVYSFGILMMEMFTRKKPTDDMFTGKMSLKGWVEESLPLAVTEVADANLLSRGYEEEEEEEADFAAKKNCISSIMRLALKCSAEIPLERMNIKDALVDLEKIKAYFLMGAQSP